LRRLNCVVFAHAALSDLRCDGGILLINKTQLQAPWQSAIPVFPPMRPQCSTVYHFDVSCSLFLVSSLFHARHSQLARLVWRLDEKKTKTRQQRQRQLDAKDEFNAARRFDQQEHKSHAL
jgi:hypothetical protein